MEHKFHNWLKNQIDTNERCDVLVGIGDDAAVLRANPNRDSMVVATDTIAEGTHFDLGLSSLELVGRKALGVNLSDLAAMGARPESAVLSFLLPKSFGLGEAQRIFQGIHELAKQFDVAVIGGDTNRWNGPLVVGATVLGSLPSGASGWPINGAMPGDAIVVSGEFGGSLKGRHLAFEPRIELASYLADNYVINAATDVSDSLSLDLKAMVSSAGMGVDLELTSIPISGDVDQGLDWSKRLKHALSDGEDFELILSVPGSELDCLFADESIGVKLSKIGVVTDQHTELRSPNQGNWSTITPQGYIH